MLIFLNIASECNFLYNILYFLWLLWLIFPLTTNYQIKILNRWFLSWPLLPFFRPLHLYPLSVISESSQLHFLPLDWIWLILVTINIWIWVIRVSDANSSLLLIWFFRNIWGWNLVWGFNIIGIDLLVEYFDREILKINRW